MAKMKSSEGVGKKIVEALKKQSEIEINPIPANQDESETFDEMASAFSEEAADLDTGFAEDEGFSSEFSLGDDAESFASDESQPFINYKGMANPVHDTLIKDLESFEIPSNIAVLKKLISQLPSGVSRQTGAQIIKQTMEALGISMKSVLQEAQQVQEGLNNSVKECHSNIQEYKKQIIVLEKQAQNYQRQYMALNELISLFIQTGNY